eukprot:CAMPEP_0175986888 /NCGR_PEP_ID=MMETSP0108-20121206/50392_1 /TAXON_ID=195067 ORGANISM="Goniomonas pacifica, Strain CCMP1869" /NCGR_SAMPLE_ID=MMETSP0108 /ASSEMBLY_ACC=CAM_ASM_000204 /LENGTH=247 /DNA_ID=CAMNT_0017318081 /DNA_START=117 /DNA_END=861 /DNA_ORIENTATION=+
MVPGPPTEPSPHPTGNRFDYWVKAAGTSYRESSLRISEFGPEEGAHYARRTCDIEFYYANGWGELWGIADRGSYDLGLHSEQSGHDLTWTGKDSDGTDVQILPEVVEPAVGLDRLFLAVLIDAYAEEGEGKNRRVVMRLPPAIAPIRHAVLPVVRKPELERVASEIADTLTVLGVTDVDVTGSIGRRYRRQDEVGTPFCVTVDSESLEDNCVTVRFRDSMNQARVPIHDLPNFLRARDHLSTDGFEN